MLHPLNLFVVTTETVQAEEYKLWTSNLQPTPLLYLVNLFS
jgi:hypothetical protein